MKYKVMTNEPVENWSETQLVDYLVNNGILKLDFIRAKQLSDYQMIKLIKEEQESVRRRNSDNVC